MKVSFDHKPSKAKKADKFLWARKALVDAEDVLLYENIEYHIRKKKKRLEKVFVVRKFELDSPNSKYFYAIHPYTC